MRTADCVRSFVNRPDAPAARERKLAPPLGGLPGVPERTQELTQSIAALQAEIAAGKVP